MSGYSFSGSCDPEEVVRPAEVVLQEDLESLRRTYSEEERVEFWNMVRSAYKDFILRCSTRLSPEVAKLIKGKYRLAMLLLAASFRLNGEGQESIISMFRDEEYEILQDFEEFKIFDSLDVDTIVEFIKRREGKVYELVRRYYEKQYNVLDKAWGRLMGDLAAAFENRYRARRRKIEEAVVRYVRRYGLIETVSEIEEAIKKVLEAGEFRRRIEEEVRRKVLEEYRVDEMRARLEALEAERAALYDAMRRLESAAGTKEVAELAAELEKVRAEKDRITRLYEEAVSRLEAVEEELARAREALAAKEEEMRRLAKEFGLKPEAVEALNAEAEVIRSTIERLRSEAEGYRQMLEAVKQEKALLEERLREVEAYLRGEVSGRLITAEEADAFTESYLRRVAYKVTGKGNLVRVADPRTGEMKEFSSWDEHRTYYLREGPPPASKAVVFVKKKGIILKKKDIVLEAVVLLHEDAYRDKGYDTKPVTLAEVVEVLRSRLEEAEAGNYYHITAIASPTGFTTKAIEFVGSRDFHRNFIARNATAYLVDLVTGEVFRNPADNTAGYNEWMIRPELPEDLVRKVMDYVLSEDAVVEAHAISPAEPMITASKIIEATGVDDPRVIRAALERLARGGWGTVIMTKDGVTAFKYSSKAIVRAGGS